MASKGLLFCLATVAVLLWAGCGEEEPTTSIRLRLTARPELNSEAQVVSVLDHIELVFDAKDGFDNVPAQGGPVGPLVAKDVDQDGKMELVLDEPVGGLSSFPLIRLLPGSNLARDFSIRAVGWAGVQAAAVGGATAVHFEEGTSSEVSVPLDLCDGHLPPRVLYTVPDRGENIGEQDIPSFSEVRVYLSKVVEATTIQNNLRVVQQGTGQVVEGRWKLHELQTDCLGSVEKRSLAIFKIDDPCMLSSGSYQVEATSGITDRNGTAFDQTALQQGSNSFSSAFTVTRTEPVGPCIGSGGPCDKDADCPPEERCELDPTSPDYRTCVLRDISGGLCQIPCPDGYVCSHADCVRDCREAGACAIGTCDPKSGLCVTQ